MFAGPPFQGGDRTHGERRGEVQGGGREAEGPDQRQERAGVLLLQHEDDHRGREGEGEDQRGGQEEDLGQVRRGHQVARRQPAG